MRYVNAAAYAKCIVVLFADEPKRSGCRPAIQSSVEVGPRTVFLVTPPNREFYRLIMNVQRWLKRFVLTLLVSSAAAADSRTSLSEANLAEATARQIDLVGKRTLPGKVSVPVFSPDSKSIAFAFIDSSNPERPKSIIEVQDLASGRKIKSITLPPPARSRYSGTVENGKYISQELPAKVFDLGLAYSPDGNRIACVVMDPASPIVVLNLKTDKATPLPGLQLEGADGRLAWPDDLHLLIHRQSSRPEGLSVNLETLKVESWEDPKLYDFAGLNAQVNSHKNAKFVLDSFGFDATSFGVESLKEPYGRVLVPNVMPLKNLGSSLRRFGWTPDLQHAYDWDLVNSEIIGTEGHCVLYRFGFRDASPLNFRLDGLKALLNDDQKAQIQNALDEHRLVWFTIFGPRKNPLTEKTLGPDKNVVRARGLLKTLGEMVQIDYGVERDPPVLGDVASDFWIRNGKSWTAIPDAWAALVSK